MPEMRILVLVQGLDVGAVYGGAERSGAELAQQLRRDGHEVALCSFWRNDTGAETRWQQRLEAEGIQVIYAAQQRETQSVRVFLRSVQRIVRQVAAKPIDVAHAHHDGGALAGLLLKRMGVVRAVVHTTHMPPEKQWGETSFGALCRLVFSHAVFPIMLDAETAIAPSFADALCRRAMARVLRRRAHLIYSAVPHGFSTVEHSCTPTDCDSTPMVGSVGRLNEQKGYSYMITAAQTVSAQLPNVRFMLVGDGEQRAALEAQARALGVAEHITFAGQQEQPSTYYRRMAVFVLPSLWEGVPAVVLESIASGVPVVATDISGNRVLVQHGESGWLVPPRDSRALANAILEALRDRAEARRRAWNARAILAQFAPARIAAQYVGLYESLLATCD
ncbi:MAG: glycosyltransferase [Chloroflexi bacterium]|nr:glycosyltransferase [Chloroflexota bacterium]